MKYFEIIEPYFALVKANDAEEASEKYIEEVADDPRIEDFKVVSRDYALVNFARSVGEDKKQTSIPEVLYIFQNDNAEVLLIDGCLI